MNTKWYALVVLLFMVATGGCKKKSVLDEKEQEERTPAALGSCPKYNNAPQLMAYLQCENPDRQQMQEAQDVVDKAQVILLHYEKDTPIKSESDRKNQHILACTLQEKGAFVTPISHHSQDGIYPQLSVTLSRFSDTQMEAKNWLEYMTLPVSASYTLKSVRIVYTPTMDMKKSTFEKCGAISVQIAYELERLKAQFKQLQNFDKNKLSAGKWGSEEWPRYPGISYRFGFGPKIPNTKGLYEKTTEDWCKIRVWFEPEKGYPQALIYPKKTYSKQGITACWLVRSADDSFNKKISQLIVRELSPLDEYKKELEVKR